MTRHPQLDLQAILPLVRKPGQYIGGELHAVSGRISADDLSFCLIFPDLYEIGMSHQGLQILYHLINAREHVVAHRAYAPDVDMEAALRRAGLPLFSLEARVSLGSYDVLGITLPYELCYTNILTVLDLAGLPLRAADRDDAHPLVLGGGSCAFNPEPVADFFDAIVLGDGEEVIIEIADLLLGAKRRTGPGGGARPAGRGPGRLCAGPVRAPLPGRPARGDRTAAAGPRLRTAPCARRTGGCAPPAAAAGAGGQAGARPAGRGNRPRVHPRLPFLPGRDALPAGARTLP
jgi:Fe-S oxidoreductase